MRQARLYAAPFSVALVLAVSTSLLLGGCAGGVFRPTSPAAGAQLPDTVDVALRLKQGDRWKSRFVSTGDVKRTLAGADGRETTRGRVSGLRVIAVQTVREVNGNVAVIEVAEDSVSVLQEGKFVEAPFRRFNPPNPVTFTVDLGTGKTDFGAMEKAYDEWWKGIQSGPAGEIMGKTFHVKGYVGQLADLYSKPFVRLAGKRFPKGKATAAEREFSLPYIGPGADLGPMPVEVTLSRDGVESSEGRQFLKVSGKYAGESPLTQPQLAERTQDFGVAVPASFASKASANGRFRARVDVLSGREMESTNEVTYRASSTFGGQTFREEIEAKMVLEPAE